MPPPPGDLYTFCLDHMISLLTTSPFTGEISDLVGVVQVQQERDIWLNKRDVRCKVQVQERALGIYGSIREM